MKTKTESDVKAYKALLEFMNEQLKSEGNELTISYVIAIRAMNTLDALTLLALLTLRPHLQSQLPKLD